MINYFLTDNELVRGSDLRELIDAINANEIYGDDSTVRIEKGSGGTFVSVIDQYGGGGGASVDITDHPFKIEESGQNIKVGGGVIKVRSFDGGGNTDYAIPAETLDLSSITSTETIYVYVKTPITRANGNDYLAIPTLTVGASNFNFNNQHYPNSDFGYYYSPVGTVTVTVVDTVKTFEINQSEYENKIINGENMHPWKGILIYETKASDTATDINYKYFINTGHSTTPEGTQILASSSGIVPITTSDSFYVLITADIAADGYKENYNSELIIAPVFSYPPNSFPLGQFVSGTVSQFRDTDLFSDGRVY